MNWVVERKSDISSGHFIGTVFFSSMSRTTYVQNGARSADKIRTWASYLLEEEKKELGPDRTFHSKANSP